MNILESAEPAQTAFDVCLKHLPPDLSTKIKCASGDPATLDKGSKPMRLRVSPKKESPKNFWGPWTRYEIIVGHVSNLTRAGLNVGSVKFFQSPSQKGSGSGAYLTATVAILRAAEAKLGQDFFLTVPQGERPYLSLTRLYQGMPSFPAEQAGKDLARLIEATLPALLQIPEIAG